MAWPDRLWNRVEKTETGCWLWTGATIPKGYGAISVEGRLELVHRVAYRLTHGTIPEGKQIDHTCHTKDCTTKARECPHRRCINPEHLEAATSHENTLRGNMVASITHCPHGHLYDQENTYYKRRKWGYGRECRACQRLRDQRYRQHKKDTESSL